MSSMSLRSLLPALVALTSISSLSTGVQAHSWVKTVTVAGKEYRGWDFNSDPYYSAELRPKSFTRKVDGNGPCLDWTAPCIIINEGTNAANLEATSPTGTIEAKAGDEVVLDWQQWPDSHIGGSAVYMADCGTTCTGADASSLSWFKIIEENYDSASGWPLSALTANPLYSFKLPTDLPASEYMVKHELLAPFSGQQFYPMAFQVKLDSAGATVPAPTGKFPDMYSDFVELSTDGPSFKYPGIAVYQNGIVKGDSGGAATAPSGEETVPAVTAPASSIATAVESVTSDIVAEPTVSAAEPITTEVEEPPIAITATATSGIIAPSDLPSVTDIQPVATSSTAEGQATSVSVVAPTASEIVAPVETMPAPTLPAATETDALPVESATTVEPEVLPSASSVPPAIPSVSQVESAPAPSDVPAVPAPTGETAGNLQKFTGSVGAPAEAVTQVGNQYASGGRTYNFLYDALEGSCNDQRNACYNAANQLPNAEVGAFQAQCESQASECYTLQRAQASIARRWSSRALA